MLENKVLREIFWTKRDTKLQENEETSIMLGIFPLYSYESLIETTEMGGTCSTYGTIEKCIQNFSGKT